DDRSSRWLAPTAVPPPPPTPRPYTTLFRPPSPERRRAVSSGSWIGTPPATRPPTASATRSTWRAHRSTARSSSHPRSSSVNQPGAVPCRRRAQPAAPASRAAGGTRRGWGTSSSCQRPGWGSSRAHSTVRRWWRSPWPARRARSSSKRVRKPLPSPEAGTRPSASHRAQSERGAAPSHWVAAAAVPHQGRPVVVSGSVPVRAIPCVLRRAGAVRTPVVVLRGRGGDEPLARPAQHSQEGLDVLGAGDRPPPLDDEGRHGVDPRLAGPLLVGAHGVGAGPGGQRLGRPVAVEADLGGQPGEHPVVGD